MLGYSIAEKLTYILFVADIVFIRKKEKPTSLLFFIITRFVLYESLAEF